LNGVGSGCTLETWRKTGALGVNMDRVEFDSSEFRKSSFSPPSNGGCVEVASREDVVAIRESKDPDGTVLEFSKRDWDLFVKGVKAGEFD
jgi:Domain of unknown function (DUF397)